MPSEIFRRLYQALLFPLLIFSIVLPVRSQKNYVSQVWVADNGNGTYKNPIIHADYSDPDAIRVGDDYYFIASSFDAVPGLPILHSRDLVNWTIIGHALIQQPPIDHFSSTQHGNGVWAPAIRFHNNEFLIYYPDPDFGIYLTRSKKITGPWSEPILVQAGKGLIDPCPFWDDDGRAWLVHAYAGSRAGIKSVIVLKKMNREGTKVVDASTIIYDGHKDDPTIEGPKIYKRNKFYYIFAPAGGVTNGWQLVLRSKNINGPYDRKVVMDQGSTSINGPHQGAWVTTKNGEDWFLHFQDKGAYGRVLHLQPMKWINDWPVIGNDKDADGKGEPVLEWKKPKIAKAASMATPVESDEFNQKQMGMQWQWQANPKSSWSCMTGSSLRLYCIQAPDTAQNLWGCPDILMQKFPASEFMATTKIIFQAKMDGERTGLVIMGSDYAGLFLERKDGNIFLSYGICKQADKGKKEEEKMITKIAGEEVYLRVIVDTGAICSFSYSLDNIQFTSIAGKFVAQPGRWIGAKLGLYSTRTGKSNDAGWSDFDWFRLEKVH